MRCLKKKFLHLSLIAMAVFVLSVSLSGKNARVYAANYREEAVKLAASQVGYHEKETNENLYDFTANAGTNDYNKYANDLWTRNGVPWGACFFWWVMANACVPKPAYPQSTAVTRTWFEERGIWREKNDYIPQPGDYVLMEDENKCGIVESVSSNSVTYIAGNIENSVVRKTCSLDDSYINGYGLIDYDYNKPPEGLDLGEVFLALIVQEDTTKRIKNNGEDVVLWDEEDSPEYKWLFTRQKDGTYTIRSLYDGKLLTVEGAGTKNDTNVYTAPDEGGASSSQKWYLGTLWGGYQFFPQHVPHFALDRVDYYDNRNRRSLKIFCANESATQFFCLSKIDYYPLESVNISNDYERNMTIGAKQALTPCLIPENASANMVTWSSSDPSVAEVDSNGMVTAKAEGTVTVSCTSTYDIGISDSIRILVKEEASEESSTQQDNTEISTEHPTEKPTETSTEIPLEKEEHTKTEQQKDIVQKGTRISDKYCYYEITSTKNKTVKVVAIKNKKRFSLKIPVTVKHKGKTYKITAIAKNAFKNNKKLKSVTIGNNVKTIGNKSFYGCTKLKKIVIGKNVTAIGDKAFYGCKKLNRIRILSTKLKKIGKDAFKKISKRPIVWAPEEKIKKYKKLFKGKS